MLSSVVPLPIDREGASQLTPAGCIALFFRGKRYVQIFLYPGEIRVDDGADVVAVDLSLCTGEQNWRKLDVYSVPEAVAFSVSIFFRTCS
jgi:hypothetical protein